MPSNDLYRDIVENMHDGVYFVDRERRITYWNKGAERITGYAAAEVVGKSCADNILVHVDAIGRQLCKGSCPLVAAMADGAPHEAEVYLHHKQGHRLPVWVRTSPLPAADGSFAGAVEIFTEIRSRQALQEQVEELKKLALVDTLTGLRNRRHLETQLHARLEELRRSGIGFGLLFLDIDHFKQFNDRHGHDVGDQVLTIVANTLSLSVRPFDIMCRWGGEEFAGIFPHTDAATLEAIAERLRILVAHSRVNTGSAMLTVTVSIGGCLAKVEDSAASLVKRADTLMYASKADGRNRVTIR
ncbi:MAG TPA: sensor domain-containing diguanylate cyclase [Desulfobacterales bacterium]|nr:sensor domain-containing diguanylate cyclase [Desulfobacterales bacterium]